MPRSGLKCSMSCRRSVSAYSGACVVCLRLAASLSGCHSGDAKRHAMAVRSDEAFPMSRATHIACTLSWLTAAAAAVAHCHCSSWSCLVRLAHLLCQMFKTLHFLPPGVGVHLPSNKQWPVRVCIVSILIMYRQQYVSSVCLINDLIMYTHVCLFCSLCALMYRYV